MLRRSVSTPRKARPAFTLIELLTVMAIIAILGAVLLPVVAQARQKAQSLVCLSSMRQLSMALNMYVQDNDSHFPTNGSEPHYVILKPYIKTDGIFLCPTTVLASPDAMANFKDHSVPPSGYAMNWYLRGATYQQKRLKIGGEASDSGVPFPATTVSFTESNYIRFKSGNPIGNRPRETFIIGVLAPIDFQCPFADYVLTGAPAALRHNKGSNYTFVDGHVKWLQSKQVQKIGEPNTGKAASFVL